MATEAETRRQRPVMSGVVALVVALAATMAWYFLGRPNDTNNAVPTVDWAAWVKAGRADKQLALYAPTVLPAGWRATSVSYVGGNFPDWVLGTLTAHDANFVGLEESKDSARKLIAAKLAPDAVPGKDVLINGVRWQTWTDAHDYALVLSLHLRSGATETVLVYGSGSPSAIRSYAGSLTPQNQLVG